MERQLCQCNRANAVSLPIHRPRGLYHIDVAIQKDIMDQRRFDRFDNFLLVSHYQALSADSSYPKKCCFASVFI
eukprot:scaffold7729_cov50-Cyclotella_meneghiniana.AAC.2